MRAAAWFEGNHAAFMASAVGMEMTTFKVGVVASAAEPERASEEAAEAADGGGGGAAKRGAEGAAGGGPAAKRSLSYGQ
jgi:hypothetical protein